MRRNSDIRRRHWWKRPRIVVPIAFGIAVLATGAAEYVPLMLGVNGTPVDVEVRIPIHYVTDSGVTIDCEEGLYVGDPAHRTAADEKLADFLKAQDWSGIGQEIYDKAIAEPFVPGPNDDWEVDTQELRDGFSFRNAESLIYERIPDELTPDGTSIGGTGTCAGQLR
ncbi:hypothetical protein L2X99_01095 [Microbacterium sp. KUDC0406]|uniref:hypothetical protein n=1 Tax=Microbacterium sp. KUDC0406 TaxID=2909588 RepID=UPI001F389984|nr:hypothetical protein [Microbacterium sp. KUDC0406]UJP10343.1 hypothetical protein L2X99_01095 [Microbacterium sp. KUDC0406]